MNRHRLVVAGFAAVLFITACPQLFAQRTRSLPISTIPTPRSVLGFNPGDDRTIADWTQITDYFTRLDKASDRVQL